MSPHQYSISISTNTQYQYQYQGRSASSISTVQYQYAVSSTGNLGVWYTGVVCSSRVVPTFVSGVIDRQRRRTEICTRRRSNQAAD